MTWCGWEGIKLAFHGKAELVSTKFSLILKREHYGGRGFKVKHINIKDLLGLEMSSIIYMFLTLSI